VIDSGLCTECRACVDLCAAEGAHAIDMDMGKFRFDSDRCTACGMCYAVCPEAAGAWDELRGRFAIDGGAIGRELAVTSAVTRSAAVKQRSADGGVATSLLWYLIDTGRIDGAILSGGPGPLGSSLFVARTRDEVLQGTGLRTGRGATLATAYGVVTNLELMTFLRELHKAAPDGRERYALVGTPCQTYALRRMQQVAVAPTPRVLLSIGLFCYEAFPLNKVQWRRFEKATGVRVEDVEKFQMREELVLTVRDGQTIRVDLDTASLLAGPNCLRCADFSNRFADLSLGATGSDPGYTTVVVRTEAGREAFDGAVGEGYLSEWGSQFSEDVSRGRGGQIRARLEAQTRKKERLTRTDGSRKDD